MPSGHVGILGATSLVGECLLPLLTRAHWRTTAFSRFPRENQHDDVDWKVLSPGVSPVVPHASSDLSHWISLAPIWALPGYFALLEVHKPRRVVALSSTSRFTKDNSTDPEERELAHRIADAETRIQAWAESHGVEWVILRPTLVYGLGRDKNIAQIARFVRRFRFFPLLGHADGLRQPIHAQDVAEACLAALAAPAAANHAYNLSGGETLTYRSMVTRVFHALDRPAHLLPLPLTTFHLALVLLRRLPRYRHWTTAMAERMNRDLVFDHQEATRDLEFHPKPFVISAVDLIDISAHAQQGL